MLMTTDLPPPVGPTIIVVCRVIIVSYSCTTLSTYTRAHRNNYINDDKRESDSTFTTYVNEKLRVESPMNETR